MTVTCVVCGTVADDPETVPLGWSMSTSERGKEFTCPRCVRENVRSIEAKLDEAWW
ncbi:MAG TPA: hypothetical protein VMK16_02030 [Acidimicrobiales bacterium]|nr:hypothetical protein [Acidimicrobiales bacterium]